MNKEILTERIDVLLRKFSIPATIGMIIMIIYNIVDRIFIAQGIGTLGIAGLSLSLPIITFYLALGLLLGVGSGVLTSISIGQKNIEKAERILGNAVVVYAIAGVVTTILSQIFLTQILVAFGASDITLPYAREYMRYLLFGSFCLIFVPGFNNIIRAEGSPKSSMSLSALGAILNIILDYIFIFPMGMGIKGAAIATVISLSISSACMILHFTHGRSNIKLRRKYLRFDKKLTKEAVAIGSAPFINQLSTSIVVIFINKNLKFYGGDISIAAYGIINSIILLFRMPVIGVQQGSQTIIGFNYGAKKFGRVREAYSLSVRVGLVISGIGFLLTMFKPELLASAFVKDDPELMKTTVNGIRLFFSLILCQGFNLVSVLTFLAIKKAHISSKLNMLQQFGLIIPLLFILPKLIGINGIWLAIPISDLTITLIVAPLIYKEMKNLKELGNG